MVEASVVEASFLLAAESTKGGGGGGAENSGGEVFLGDRCRIVDVGGQKSGRTR